MILACRWAQKPSIMAEKPRFRRRTVFPKNLGFGVGFGYRNNTNRHAPKSGGGVLCPLLGGAGSPSNTISPGPRPTSVPSGILNNPTVWPQQTWVENWWWQHQTQSNTMWHGMRPTSVPSGILIHPAVWSQYMGWKLGGCCPPFFGEGEMGPHLTQCRLSWGLPPCQVASWSNQLFGHKRHGQKIGGGVCAPLRRGNWFPI